ncbi:MAG: heparinase II/III family protein [Hyphomicrobiaceae bacterium]|nr:heparinase II/III family protein [Hyphomicrobiaceae bacterium]MCC0007214.1 heparinase II/III family protein [Hyphomicrobiaceae bacterium]
MARLTLQERLEFTAIEAERARRGLIARALNSPTLRWRYGTPRVDQLLIVPQDLRSADPSFWLEVRNDQFGLAGCIARLDGRSPFDIRPPNRNWSHALNGFGWLRHLAAAAETEATDAARQLAVEWIIRNAKGTGEAWRPDVLARRVISWLSHANLLLDDADERTYHSIATSLGYQLVRLSSAWREAPAGAPRLLALMALVYADLCVAGRDRRLEVDQPMLIDEFRRQILPDGGHVSRNPSALVEILLDLLPLRQCFRARGRKQPAQLDDVATSMLDMLRFLRLGDGLLARFNGVSVGMPARLSTVMAYADPIGSINRHARSSGYERLQQGDTILVADVGAPPPVVLAGASHAGCLSFELSCDTEILFSNAGAPGSAHADWASAARATANHNTLVLGETSSSRLIGTRRIEQLLGSLPIRGPAMLSVEGIGPAEGQVGFAASHNGYVERYGLVHARRIVMENDGRRIVGTDELKPPGGIMRLKRDLPYAIHFHLHPGVTCRRGDKVGTVFIDAGEQRWRMAAEGARIVIEESKYFADATGPVRRLQIVLRGATYGESEVRWAISRQA